MYVGRLIFISFKKLTVVGIHAKLYYFIHIGAESFLRSISACVCPEFIKILAKSVPSAAVFTIYADDPEVIYCLDYKHT